MGIAGDRIKPATVGSPGFEGSLLITPRSRGCSMALGLFPGHRKSLSAVCCRTAFSNIPAQRGLTHSFSLWATGDR